VQPGPHGGDAHSNLTASSKAYIYYAVRGNCIAGGGRDSDDGPLLCGRGGRPGKLLLR